MARIRDFRPHPWHGVAVGPDMPRLVNAYIEITPFDTVKYEVDKDTGYLAVDRPRTSASLPPTLYGFVPRTYCGPRVAKIAGAAEGDGDPLDICVISERNITRADILLRARPVGGLRMIDAKQADDKIIAVLERDPFWSEVTDLDGLPKALVDRLRHYFTTYKLKPGGNPVDIDVIYGVETAMAVVEAAAQDYWERFRDE